MRRERRASPLRGLLLFLLGALVGANAVYFLLTRGGADAVATPANANAADGRIELPLPARDPAAAEAAPPTGSVATPATHAPSAPAVPASGLLIPVQGVQASQLQDTFADARGTGRVHDAIDIMAAAGTPVLAVADGHVEKLFDSKPGGITLYQFDPSGSHAYYYAHLQGYAAGIVEGKALRRGETIGYVGATGNASPDAPHLHFGVFVLGPERQWWKGKAVNPYPLLGGATR